MDFYGRHYREVLSNELENRQRVNSNYSLRAFAKSLGINPTTLSMVLQGKRSLSAESAHKICDALGMDPLDAKIFQAMVWSLDGKSQAIRLKYTKELNELLEMKSGQNRVASYFDFSLARFRVLSDWYHLAILECLHLSEYSRVSSKKVSQWLHKKLGISTNQVLVALDRLRSLELVVEKKGKPVPSEGILYTGDREASAAIRNHHKQYLEMAIASLEKQDISERDISGIVVEVDESQIPEAKKMIQEFRKKMNSFLRLKKTNCVYRLGINFFKLTKNLEEE